jgi:vancomycin aglycone glucosyltransferase
VRALISSVGTRGDVQPALALALEVRALGYDVRMCVPPNFVEWAAQIGLDARPIGIEMRAPRGAVSTAPVAVPDLIADQFITIEKAAADCGVIIGAGIHQYAARSVAERDGIPCVVAAYAPVSLPSENLVPPGSADLVSDPITIRRLWDETRRGWNDRALTRVNGNRSRLGLAPIEDVLEHILDYRPWLAADATLGPAPATSGLRVVQTGAWILHDSRPLDRELEAFVEQGEPPVYIGLGSMPAPEGTSATLVAAARAAGRRAILSRGWADLDVVDIGQDCLVVGDVNQQALFPRVAAVVHHGGAGTATTAARAGTPQVALPMFSDQFYWGHRLRELGIGSTVPFRESTADKLASALRDALDPDVRTRAVDVAQKITGDGARIAARQLRALVNAGSSVATD